MFIREQLINSVHDLKPSCQDEDMLDAWVNSPRTCRWQNWTFQPGYYTSPKLTYGQYQNLMIIHFNIGMLSRYPTCVDRVEELRRGVGLYLLFCYGKANYNDLPLEVQNLIHNMPAWGTNGT